MKKGLVTSTWRRHTFISLTEVYIHLQCVVFDVYNRRRHFRRRSFVVAFVVGNLFIARRSSCAINLSRSPCRPVRRRLRLLSLLISLFIKPVTTRQGHLRSLRYEVNLWHRNWDDTTRSPCLRCHNCRKADMCSCISLALRLDLQLLNWRARCMRESERERESSHRRSRPAYIDSAARPTTMRLLQAASESAWWGTLPVAAHWNMLAHTHTTRYCNSWTTADTVSMVCARTHMPNTTERARIYWHKPLTYRKSLPDLVRGTRLAFTGIIRRYWRTGY